MDSGQRKRDFGALISKWDLFIKPPLKFGDLCGKECRKILVARGVDDSNKAEDTTGLIHI